MSDFTTVRWATCPSRDRLTREIEAIFFETSATKSFPDAQERARFQERWLGRYLACDPSFVYVGLTPAGTVAGYLVGCVSDPAITPRFADIPYLPDFAALSSDYPAHLHVNVAPQWQGRRVGAALIGAFLRDALEAGASGVHVVTGTGMRNVGFYERNDFRQLGTTVSNGRSLSFLGRKLD